MGGFYKLREKDAKNLYFLLHEFRSDALLACAGMLMCCWANMRASSKPCPNFNIGSRQIAQKCGTSRDQARRMLNKLEKQGLVVKLGEEKIKHGTFTKRTFWWVAEEHGVGRISAPPPGRISAPPMNKTAEESAPPIGQNAGKSAPYQGTTYLIDAGRFSADAEAPAYASEREIGAEEWYVLNGLPIPEAPPPPKNVWNGGRE